MAVEADSRGFISCVSEEWNGRGDSGEAPRGGACNTPGVTVVARVYLQQLSSVSTMFATVET
jgi:hypothetical protein